MYERFERAEKLLMRIRSLKWHAGTIASSSADAGAREEAAAIVEALKAVETASRATSTDATLTAWEQQIDALAVRLATLGPE